MIRSEWKSFGYEPEVSWMGWLIAIIIIILIAANSDKKGNTSAAGNEKNRQEPLKSQKKINRYIELRETKPASWKLMEQIDEAVDDLMDEYLYYYGKKTPEFREEAAIMDVFDRYPWCYRGKKYSQYRGQLVDDALRDLRKNIR